MAQISEICADTNIGHDRLETLCPFATACYRAQNNDLASLKSTGMLCNVTFGPCICTTLAQPDQNPV